MARKKKTGLIIKLVFLGLAVYVVISFIQLQVELSAKQERLAQLQQEYDQQLLTIEELQGVWILVRMRNTMNAWLGNG